MKCDVMLACVYVYVWIWDLSLLSSGCAFLPCLVGSWPASLGDDGFFFLFSIFCFGISKHGV